MNVEQPSESDNLHNRRRRIHRFDPCDPVGGQTLGLEGFVAIRVSPGDSH